jgi:iron complex transport system substrate-binding protein
VARSLVLFARLFCCPFQGELRKGKLLRSTFTNRVFTGAIAQALVLTAAFAIAQGTVRAAPASARSAREQAAQSGAARIVTDEVGRRVTIPADVRRIVTLAPNLTETVYALGLEDRLAGDTNYCDTPPAAKSKPHVGDPQNPNLEAIVALHPDLVLATTSINRLETADALAHLGIPVYTTDSPTVRGMLDSVAHVAGVTGAEAQGATLVANLKNRLDALHARLADRPLVHVLFVVWEDPLITIGQNTFIADALRFAGAESVVLSKQNWPHVSMEEIIRLQPDYIVLTPNHNGPNGESSGAEAELGDLRARPVWKDLLAVDLGHVVVAGDDALRPSPGLIDAIEQLAHKLHPEVFSAQSEMRNPTRQRVSRSAHSEAIQLTASDVAQDTRCESCAR